IGAAAVLLLAIGAALFVSRSNPGTRGNQITSRQLSVPELSAQLDLRRFTAIRGDEKQREPEPVSLPLGRVNATILLPVGSDAGMYEVQVLDSDLRSRISTSGAAQVQDHVTTLQATLDLRSLNPGSYQLAVRREDESWRMFPLRVHP